jgi:hypothetical protein
MVWFLQPVFADHNLINNFKVQGFIWAGFNDLVIDKGAALGGIRQ